MYTSTFPTMLYIYVINKSNIVARKFCEHKISRSISCVFLVFNLVPKIKKL